MAHTADPHHKVCQLNVREGQAIYSLFHHDPVTKMCRQLIVSSVLSGGIQCLKGGKDATPDFQDILDQYWMPFARDVLDSFFMFGFAVCSVATKSQRVGQRKKAKVEVPVVPPFGQYTMEVRMDTETYEQTLHFVPLRSTIGADLDTRDDASKTVLLCDDGMPNVSDGAYRSRVSTLLEPYRFVQRMRNYAVQAEHIRSHPPLITQDNPDKRPVNETLSEEAFADPSELFHENEERRYRKNASTMNAMLNQQRMASELNRAPDVIQDGLPHDPHTVSLTQSYHDNTFHLPDGTQIATQAPMPQCRTDLAELDRLRIDKVCGTFGVPKSLVGFGTGARQGAQEVEYRMLMRTVEAHAAVLARTLHQVYNQLYGSEDSVEFSLPFMPLTSIDHIQQIFHEGVISKETQGKYLLRACGLPLMDLAIQPQAATAVAAAPDGAAKNCRGQNGGGSSPPRGSKTLVRLQTALRYIEAASKIGVEPTSI